MEPVEAGSAEEQLRQEERNKRGRKKPLQKLLGLFYRKATAPKDPAAEAPSTAVAVVK
jgi:hypothetical protein